MANLKEKTLTGLFWSITDSFGSYFIRFAFSIAIARVLEPSDYGLMGMIIIFMSIGRLITESGFGMSLIQKKNATDIDFSTIFYFNIFISIIIYAILFFSAPTIANFFEKPILVNIVRISSFTIVLGGLGSIQTTIFSKELNFKKQTQISWVATISSGITGVIIAYNGFAVWALVFQAMAGSIIRLFGLWISSNWRPLFCFSWKSFIELYKYAYKIFLSGLSEIIFTKFYFPLIGKYFSATQLGYYSNANSFSEIIVKQTAIAYGRVLFPVMSLIQDDKEKLKRSYAAIFRLLSFIMVPVSVIAIISSQPFVAFFLTSKWLPAVPFMQLMLLEGLFFSLYMFNQHTFYSIGFSGLALKVEIVKKIFIVISFFISFQFGIEFLIIGYVLSSFLAFLFSLFHIHKELKIKISILFFELFKLMVISIAVYFINYFILQAYISTTSLLLLSEIIILPLIFLISIYILKVRALDDLCTIFGKKMPDKIVRIIKSRLSS